MHFFTVLVWVTLKLNMTTYGHSGFKFPWVPFGLIPLRATSTYHNYHHTTNVGNYSGSFSIWDTVFGSNFLYNKYYAEINNKIKT
jgi:sterol desaturase/sphingolipid hydroxylase (fatty acid hydroxylase superfamily)